MTSPGRAPWRTCSCCSWRPESSTRSRLPARREVSATTRPPPRRRWPHSPWADLAGESVVAKEVGVVAVDLTLSIHDPGEFAVLRGNQEDYLRVVALHVQGFEDHFLLVELVG